MALNWNDWEKNTSKYVIYSAFGALAFFTTQFVWQSYEREARLINELAKTKQEYEEKITKLETKIDKLRTEKDTLYKLVGYINGVNQSINKAK